MRSSRTGRTPQAIMAALATRGRRRARLARGAGNLARSLVQHQRRRRLLPLPPLVERRPVDAVRGPARTTSHSVKAGESLERPIERLQAERQQLIEDYRELLGLRRGARRLRPDDHAGAPGVPVRRGPQVLLRALVHEPVLQQDPRVRRAARGARLLRATPRTCSSSRTTRSSPRSSTS